MMIRQATKEDIPELIRIFEYAREFMIANGNPTQWAKGYPPRDALNREIEEGRCFCVADDTGVHGVFTFTVGIDPTYSHMEGGEWLNEEPYGTIHRIAGDGTVHGIFTQILKFCEGMMLSRGYRNVRGDTHADNKPMQHLFEKNGFSKLGIIYVANGTPRIAYQKVLEQGPADSKIE